MNANHFKFLFINFSLAAMVLCHTVTLTIRDLHIKTTQSIRTTVAPSFLCKLSLVTLLSICGNLLQILWAY